MRTGFVVHLVVTGVLPALIVIILLELSVVFVLAELGYQLLLVCGPFAVDVGTYKLKQNLRGSVLGALLIPAVALGHLDVVDLDRDEELHVRVVGELVHSIR